MQINNQNKGVTPHFDPSKMQVLRDIAEQQAKEQNPMSEDSAKPMTPAEVRETLHELQVHQIELAMQNEDLRTTQLQLEESRSKYFDLYEQAPVGYFTLLESDKILDVNLVAAKLFGLTQDALAGDTLTRFIHKHAQDTRYLRRKALFETGELQVFDLKMINSGGEPFWGNLSMTLSKIGRAHV